MLRTGQGARNAEYLCGQVRVGVRATPRSRVAGTRCRAPAPSEPCVRVSPRTRLKQAARALQAEAGVPVSCARGLVARAGRMCALVGSGRLLSARVSRGG